MNGAIEGGGHLVERQLTGEPLAGPAAGSLVLHAALVGLLVYYGWILGLFHHNLWGSQGAGGAMQVSLVSNAIPLPSTQPLNKNVLTTETPSQAPALPSPKETHKVDETAIPIAGKQAKTEKQTAPKTQMHQPPPKDEDLARYGEQTGTSIPHAMQPQNFTSGQTSVSDVSFGSMFSWYVGQIDRKMDSSSYRAMADPHTPKGARAYIEFAINRDGSHGAVKLDTPSGSPSWDNVCVRAAQRVDTFGPLPGQYTKSSLLVSYYCEY
ncbi:MAG: TonB C-terminal domain-containing protein [Terracidiphilus sp.]